MIEELKNNLKEYYTQEEIDNILKGYNIERYTTLRVNNLKSNINEIKEILTNNNINYEEVSWYQDALIIINANELDIQKLDIYKEGKIYLQSLSSMLPPLILNPKENSQILDMCASPGGKTSEIASICHNNIMITAVEKDKIRFNKLKYNLELQGVKKCSLLNIDALNLDNFYKFDKILLDTPCSGSGTYYKEIKYNKDYLNKLTNLQTKLLIKAISMLKEDSELVYSTCSIFKEENEQVINKILNMNLGIEMVPIEGYNELPRLSVTIPGSICLYPNKYYEGFYIIKLKKNKAR